MVAGNMSTIKSNGEVWLAESLADLLPWSEMVRIGRSADEAKAIALHIACTSTGRDTVDLCGCHSWYDWGWTRTFRPTPDRGSTCCQGVSPIECRVISWETCNH